MNEMIGYKILNEDLTCRDFKFDISQGVVNHLGNDEPLELCKNGFHFCEHPSGVWAYYSEGRVFRIKACDVLDTQFDPGADRKLVCRSVEFLEEVANTGRYNTGDYNTGDRNTGDYNTGHRNTGDYNTGDRNTGDYNTGHRNTGDYNTGRYNTGHRNTGDYNTGHRNTGHRNTGDYNTGHRNTGDYNTGDYNTGDYNIGYRWAGSLNFGDAPIYLFNKVVEGGSAAVDTHLVCELGKLLAKDEPIDPTPFLSLPNASEAAIKRLHEAAKAARCWMREGSN